MPDLALKPISNQPAYAAVVAERADLAAALAKVNSHIAEIEAIWRTTVPTEERDSNHVEGALHFFRTGEVRRQNTATEFHEKHVLLRQQREALEKAINARSETMRSIVGELSAGLSTKLEQTHRAMAARYCDLLKQLDALYEEETQLFNTIEAAGYNPRFREQIRWPLLGRLSMRGESALWSHLRDIEQYVGK